MSKALICIALLSVTLVIMVAIISVALVTASLRVPPPSSTYHSPEEAVGTPAVGTPVPFDHFAKIITLDDLITLDKNSNLDLYLPTWMPGQIRLTAIYYSGIVILSYSDKGITNYRYANVTFEISTAYHSTPSSEELKHIAEQDPSNTKVLNIDGVWVVLIEKAHWGWPELEELYGPVPFAYFWRNSHYYMVSVKPPITSDQLVCIIRSMKLLTS